MVQVRVLPPEHHVHVGPEQVFLGLPLPDDPVAAVDDSVSGDGDLVRDVLVLVKEGVIVVELPLGGREPGGGADVVRVTREILLEKRRLLLLLLLVVAMAILFFFLLKEELSKPG